MTLKKGEQFSMDCSIQEKKFSVKKRHELHYDSNTSRVTINILDSSKYRSSTFDECLKNIIDNYKLYNADILFINLFSNCNYAVEYLLSILPKFESLTTVVFKYLDFKDKNEVNALLSTIKSKSNIKEIHINSCNLNEIPLSLTKFKNLEILGLSNNQISNLSVVLNDIHNLSSLDLNCNRIQKIEPNTYNLHNLEHVGLCRSLDKSNIELDLSIFGSNKLKSINLGFNPYLRELCYSDGEIPCYINIQNDYPFDNVDNNILYMLSNKDRVQSSIYGHPKIHFLEEDEKTTKKHIINSLIASDIKIKDIDELVYFHAAKSECNSYGISMREILQKRIALGIEAKECKEMLNGLDDISLNQKGNIYG